MRKGDLPGIDTDKRVDGTANGAEGTKVIVDAANVPALFVAQSKQQDSGKFTTSSGVRVRVVPVSGSLMDAVQNQISKPIVPNWFNDDKGREEPNPGDPAYLDALSIYESRRMLESMRAMLLFGVELIDGLPPDEKWLKKLRMVGIEVDVDDPFAVELAYKQYIAIASPLDLAEVVDRAGLSEEAVRRSLANFQRPT